MKFEVYRRKEDGAWMTGIPGKQERLSLGAAVDIARKQRDQLLKGFHLLESLAAEASDSDYRKLQEELAREAPDVVETAWAHKYFHLLFPHKLDDYHVSHYQRFHLIKILQAPPEGDGRYLAAGRFLALARELGMHVNHLTSCLSNRNGIPYKWWRVGTKDRPLGDDFWPQMQDGNHVAVGWKELGDLSDHRHNQASLDAIKSLTATVYPDYMPQLVGRKAREVFNFVIRVAERDLVLASDGSKVLGIGRITGPYTYNPDSDFPHLRPVEWLSLREWTMPHRECLQTTVCQLKSGANLIEVERRVMGKVPDDGKPRPSQPTPLPDRLEQINQILERKGQVILYGPPGTGKTYWAIKAARELAARANFGKEYARLTQEEYAAIIDPEGEGKGLVRMCTFHPSYGYEDFIEGYRPERNDQGLDFSLKPGIFKRLCKQAEGNFKKRFFLVIDEINRGDIPRIFGELLTILEKDKRGQSIILPISGEPFRVPENIFIIGTMNTADRSIALLDTALRRRFGFLELMPDYKVLSGVVLEVSSGAGLQRIPLGRWLEALNSKIMEHVGRDARNLQVGHAYLMDGDRPITDFSKFVRALRHDIIPLLEEYCYEDYRSLEAILGRDLVDAEQQRIKETIFGPEKLDQLVVALLSIDPELASSREAQQAPAEPEEEPGEEEPQDESEK